MQRWTHRCAALQSRGGVGCIAFKILMLQSQTSSPLAGAGDNAATEEEEEAEDSDSCLHADALCCELSDKDGISSDEETDGYGRPRR